MIVSSTTSIRQTVHQYLDMEHHVCVFPTETAVRFWADDYVKRSAKGVVRLDRMMAWDRFKALFLPVEDLRPANAMIRHFFAVGFLQDANHVASLKWFRYPSFPEATGNLSGAIARLLPRLEELARMRSERPEDYGRLPQAYRDDAQRIATAYHTFLEDHGYFEPRFQQPSMEHLTAVPDRPRYIIFFPEVCSGWQQFSTMEPFPDWIELCTIDATQKRTELAWFPNELMELKAQLDRVEHLLEQQVHWEDIMITIGDGARWHPHLLHEAALRDIPLDIIEGLGVLSHTPGRFLQAIQDLYTHRFSMDVMKSFLLDPRFPFKDRSLIRNLILRALECSVEMGALDSQEDDWLQSFSRSFNDEDKTLRTWYATFKQQVGAVVRSTTVETLSRSLFALQDFLFEKGAFSGTEGSKQDLLDANVYAFCLDFLRQMQQNLESCGIESTPRLYALYLQFLQKQRYISADRRPGIPVYRYTVSVGMCSTHHVLIGCTEEITRQRPESFPLIPESVWQDGEDGNLTDDFIDHYRLGGDHVHWSASQSAFGGASSLAPAWFVDHDAVVDCTFEAVDRIQEERKVWAGKVENVWRPNHLQTRWFDQAMKTAYRPPRYDLADSRPSIPLWNQMVASEGSLTISSTMLDAFVDCPMKWVAKYVFQVEKGTFGLQRIDHRQVGIVLHSVLEKFFRAVTELSGSFRADLADQYTDMLLDIAQEEFGAYAASAKAPSKTTMWHVRKLYTDQLLAIVSAEAKVFDDFTSVAFEQKLRHDSDEGPYTLEGRIDRILEHIADDGTKTIAVVDYKKQINSRKRDYDDVSESIPSHQLPIYALLIHDQASLEEPQSVAVAAYYDIAKGAYRVIWTEGEAEKREQMIALVKNNIGVMVDALKAGKFGTTTSNEPCKRCDYRQICRRRYTLV